MLITDLETGEFRAIKPNTIAQILPVSVVEISILRKIAETPYHQKILLYNWEVKQKKEIVIQAEAPSSELGVCRDTLSGKGSHRLNDNDRLRSLILKATTRWISRHCPLTFKACDEKVASPESQSPDFSSSKSATKVLVSLANLGSAQPSHIATSTGLSEPTVQRRLKELLAAGLIVKSGRTRGVRYALPKTKK